MNKIRYDACSVRIWGSNDFTRLDDQRTIRFRECFSTQAGIASTSHKQMNHMDAISDINNSYAVKNLVSAGVESRAVNTTAV
jgi:hypothetical protein